MAEYLVIRRACGSVVFAWMIVGSVEDISQSPRDTQRHGTVECDACQFFAVLGLHYFRTNPHASFKSLCDWVGASDWTQHISHLIDNAEKAWPNSNDLSLHCAESWQDLEANACASGDDFSSRSLQFHSFSHMRQLLCVDRFVCNVYTVWTLSEEESWRHRLAIGPDGTQNVSVTCSSVSSKESDRSFGDEDDDWLTLDDIPSISKHENTSAQGDNVDMVRSVEILPDGHKRSQRVLQDPPIPSDTPRPPGDPLAPRCAADYQDDYQDLRTTRIVVVIFSGRGSRLRILLPYIRRDMRIHGGVIDHIIFALIRPDDGALALIGQMQTKHGKSVEVRDYTEKRWGPSGPDPSHHRMANLYTSLNEAGTVYVKIDDDIVYLAKHAVAELVREKLRGRCMFVSANVINHAILSAVHQEHGAHREFAPPPEFEQEPTSRRPWHRVGDVNLDPSYVFEKYPMSSCVLKRWDCAAIAHESFLDRRADGTLCVFDFGWLDFNRAGFREHTYVHLSPWAGRTWDATGARWSINLFAFVADDMHGVDWSRVYGPGDDEEEFGSNHGERRNGHACALGRSLAVHFSYNTQEERLLRFTDLLERYASLADSEVGDFSVD